MLTIWVILPFYRMPALVQFLLVQLWWIITYPHHYKYSERERIGRGGKKVIIIPSERGHELISRYLLFRERKFWKAGFETVQVSIKHMPKKRGLRRKDK